ncbi:hypothetical protein CB1_001118034 [Camelus ferus]|nr:hypothetical protein CB1_001118034 [Camelus ferus]
MAPISTLKLTLSLFALGAPNSSPQLSTVSPATASLIQTVLTLRLAVGDRKLVRASVGIVSQVGGRISAERSPQEQHLPICVVPSL